MHYARDPQQRHCSSGGIAALDRGTALIFTKEKA
jgi:hypothetical protein